MPNSIDTYTASGATDQFAVTFDYLLKSHVAVTVDNVADTTFTWPDAATVQLTSTPAAAAVVRIQRTTPITALYTTFTDGSVRTAADLNDAQKQALFNAQERDDAEVISLDLTDDKYGANSKVIKEVATPTTSTDAVNKAYADAIAAAAGNVTTPTDPGEDDYVLKAGGGTFAWYATGATGRALLQDATAEAARVELEVDKAVQVKTTNYTMIASNVNNLLRWSSAGTYALMAVADAGTDFAVDIFADNGVVVIDPDAAELVNGAATWTVPAGVSGTLICDGSEWRFLVRNGGQAGQFAMELVEYADLTRGGNNDLAILEFTHTLEAGYIYELRVKGYSDDGTSNNWPGVRFRNDGGTLLTSSGDYREGANVVTATGYTGSVAQAYIAPFDHSGYAGDVAAGEFTFSMSIYNAMDTAKRTHVIFDSCFLGATTTHWRGWGSAQLPTADGHNKLNVISINGNSMDAGAAYLYRIKEPV